LYFCLLEQQIVQIQKNTLNNTGKQYNNALRSKEKHKKYVTPSFVRNGAVGSVRNPSPAI
jgi:hypothetical protein